MPVRLANAVLLAALAVFGCAPPPFEPRPEAPVAIAARASLRVDLTMARTVLGAVNRWKAADIHTLKVKVLVADGDGYVDAGLAQDVAPSTTSVTFDNLAGGQRYRVDVQAWGNAGGTAATTHLNAATPCTADFDFSGTGDLTTARTGSVAVALDPVTFSGTAVVTLSATPRSTRYVTAELWVQGEAAPKSTQTFAATPETVTFGGLAAGPTYFARVIARDAAGAVLAGADTPTWRYDPTTDALDPDIARDAVLAALVNPSPHPTPSGAGG